MSVLVSADDRPDMPVEVPKRLAAPDRRRQLIEVALRVFADKGYAAATMDDVAEAAGVTKPLVYQHFSSKRALYLELVDSVAAGLVDAIGRAVADAEGPRQQVENGFAAYFHLVVRHRDAFLLLYDQDHRDPELDDARRTVENAIVETIDPLIAAGLDPEHRRFLAHAVIGMAEGASRYWLAFRNLDRPSDRTGPIITNRVEDPEALAEAQRMAGRVADLAWAGLRSVHAD